MQFAQHGIIASSINSFNLAPDAIFLILVGGQSNATGRAESRRLALTEYHGSPQRIYSYWKPTVSGTDDGNWEPVVAGVNTREFDQSVSTYGGYLIAAIKLRDYLNREVYIVNTGDGGTSLAQDLADPDWHPSSLIDNYLISRYRYYSVAVGKLVAAYPGRQIVTLRQWWQGESDAANATAVSNYLTNFTALDSRDNSGEYPYLAYSPWFISKIDYQPANDEAGINTALQTFVDLHADRAYIFDPSSYPQKDELTTGEKGGYTPSAADDDHQSYIAQNAFGEWMFTNIVSHFGLTSAGLSEITDNTAFNPSTISTNYVRLQFNRSNVTIGTSNAITAVANDLTGASFTLSNTQRFKVDGYKGWVFFDAVSPYNTGRMQTGSAIGSTYFSGSFSFATWFKPASAIPNAIMTFLHDVQNTGSPANSRVHIYLTTLGEISVIYSQGGVSVQALTDNPVFTDSKTDEAHHLAVTFDDTNNIIKIYFDGVLQTLDATGDGNLSTVTMSSYTNATNSMQIGARKTGASTYDMHYFGLLREYMIQPVVYSQADINNLMLN